MIYLKQLMENDVLLTACIGWFSAQILKVIFVFFTARKFDFTRLTGAGGMPSSHSSAVVSLSMAVGFSGGFNSIEFAISAILALIVMYDAAGVRRSAGQQAAVLNKIVASWGKDNRETDKQLKELLGHTPIEVIAGAVLGAIIAIIVYV